MMYGKVAALEATFHLFRPVWRSVLKEGNVINVLFIGDIVGSVGRKALKDTLPSLKAKYNPHVIIVNGENAASGRGITQSIAKDFFEWGVHGITMGNHTWDNKDIFDFIDDEPRMIRPANFPPGTPGRGAAVIKANGKELAIVNLQGRTFRRRSTARSVQAMKSSINCAKNINASWLIFTPKRRRRKSRWDGTWTVALRLSSARTRMCKAMTIRFCPEARPI